MKCKICLKETKADLKVIGEGGKSVEAVKELYVLVLDKKRKFNIYEFENQGFTTDRFYEYIENQLEPEGVTIYGTLCKECAVNLSKAIININEYAKNISKTVTVTKEMQRLNSLLEEISKDSSVLEYIKINEGILNRISSLYEAASKDEDLIYNSVIGIIQRMVDRAYKKNNKEEEECQMKQ